MAIAAIILLTAPAPTTTTIIEKLTVAFKSLGGAIRFVVGTKVQEPTTIQITSEWPCFHTTADLSSSSDFRSFNEAICAFTSSPTTVILASLDKSLFVNRAPPLVEFVKTDFPAKLATADLQKQIEEDFAKFERIYRKRGAAKETGEVSLSVGWAEEQHSNGSENAREKVKSFLVIRGWEGMSRFEEAVQSEVFRECIPILLGWNAPFDLWHVERKAVFESS